MNLHLVDDNTFINDSYQIFEKFYPDQNIFIVNKIEQNFKHVIKRKGVYGLPLENHDTLVKITELIRQYNVNNILVHYLYRKKASVVLYLKREFNVKIYWIFYGSDLYVPLNVMGRYKLYDQSLRMLLKKEHLKQCLLAICGRYNRIISFIQQLDYFCFWNVYDYQLLRENFQTSAELKEFIYFSAINSSAERDLQKAYSSLHIMINHAATEAGNHITIFRKLKKIDSNNKIDQLLLPLSYGNMGRSRLNTLIKEAKDLFGERIVPILEYLPKETYYTSLNNISVAIFGHRRQEAAANVSFLLKNGVKVFLRESNNMLRYYRDCGYYIYSFENDLNSFEDLMALPVEIREHNHNIFKKFNTPEYVERFMTELNL